MKSITLFHGSNQDEDIALQQLRFFKPNDQVSIHTERALLQLQMVEKEIYV